jgi:hypothetical protein
MVLLWTYSARDPILRGGTIRGDCSRKIARDKAIHTASDDLGTVQVDLAKEARYYVDTATAAYYLNRKPQTLRSWASLDNGPIRPKRGTGRLAWSVREIRALLNFGDDSWYRNTALTATWWLHLPFTHNYFHLELSTPRINPLHRICR